MSSFSLLSTDCPSTGATHLKLDLFAKEAQVILRDHLRIRRQDDFEIALSESLLEVIANLRTFRLGAIVCLDVDLGSEFLKFSDPVFERRGGYKNEVWPCNAFLLQVRNERDDLDRLAETWFVVSVAVRSRPCERSEEIVSPISSARIQPISLDHKRFNQLTPRS